MGSPRGLSLLTQWAVFSYTCSLLPLLGPDPWGTQSALLASFRHSFHEALPSGFFPPSPPPPAKKKKSLMHLSHLEGSGQRGLSWMGSCVADCWQVLQLSYDVLVSVWSQCRSYSFCFVRALKPQFPPVFGIVSLIIFTECIMAHQVHVSQALYSLWLELFSQDKFSQWDYAFKLSGVFVCLLFCFILIHTNLPGIGPHWVSEHGSVLTCIAAINLFVDFIQFLQYWELTTVFLFGLFLVI